MKKIILLILCVVVFWVIADISLQWLVDTAVDSYEKAAEIMEPIK